MDENIRNQTPEVKAGLTALLAALLVAGCGGGRATGPVKASGTIEATQVDVASLASGRVRQLRVDEGSAVKAGDTLAVLDNTGPGFQFSQAQAGVDLADAQLRLLLNGARAEDLAQAEAQVSQAETNAATAQADARRADELFASGSMAQKQRDDADARSSVAQAQLEAAHQGLAKLERFARPEDISSARARLDQARAARDFALKNLNDCYITAPINGTVTSKAVETGDLVTPGGVVVSLSRLDTVNLMIYVSEKELPRVKIGAETDVKIDALPRRVFPGKVVYISPVAEFTPKNIQTREDRVKLVFGVKVEIPNSDGSLKPGLPADAVVKTAGEEKAKS